MSRFVGMELVPANEIAVGDVLRSGTVTLVRASAIGNMIIHLRTSEARRRDTLDQRETLIMRRRPLALVKRFGRAA